MEDAFEAREDDEGFALVVVVDNAELDVAVALLDDGRLRTLADCRISAHRRLTFSGNGMRFISGLASEESLDSLCLIRLAAEGDDGSSSALRLVAV